MTNITIDQVYNELKNIENKMVTKTDIEALMETLEILKDQDTMKQIKESNEDIKQGRVKKISSTEDLLREM